MIIWLMMLWNHVGVRGSPWPWCYGLYYLNSSSGDLTNTSSYMCGSWYLPIFLFRDGSFTPINTASLMVLAMLWSSLCTILKLSRDNSWLLMLWRSWMGDGTFMFSLNLSANVLPDSPMYSSSKSTLPHLNLYITPLFCRMVSLSLGCTRRSLMVLPPLKNTSTPYLLQMFLQLLPIPWTYGTTM